MRDVSTWIIRDRSHCASCISPVLLVFMILFYSTPGLAQSETRWEEIKTFEQAKDVFDHEIYGPVVVITSDKTIMFDTDLKAMDGAKSQSPVVANAISSYLSDFVKADMKPVVLKDGTSFRDGNEAMQFANKMKTSMPRDLEILKAVAARITPVTTYYRGVSVFRGTKSPQNYAQAKAWWLSHATNGASKAQFAVGDMLFREKDYSKSLPWLNQAASQNDADALFLLGTCYAEGLGVTADLKKGWDYTVKSAEQGNPHAQFSIAIVQKNPSVRKMWLQKAADQGYAPAKKALSTAP